MNTQQLGRSIARHLDVPDASNLPAEAALDVVNAINSGLHQFFSEAPAVYKRKTFSLVFKAPVNVNVTFTGQYATTVSGTPFNASWRGCGIKSDSMAVENEIVSTSEVLDPWTSPTLSVQLQVLFDCMVIPVTIERLTSDVRAYYPGREYGTVLFRDHKGIIDRRRRMYCSSQGRPDRYSIEPTAIVAGGSISSLLKIHPAPLEDTIIRFEAEISAGSVTIKDLVNGAVLPIADSWVPLLTPLCEDALSYSPLWKNARTKNDIRQNAVNTIANRIKKLAQDFACPSNQVGTPCGY